jgi:holo-ACP synthase CitX
MDIFEGGHTASLAEILNNRDWRVRKQNELMTEFPESTIVSIKLNVPGRIKNSTCLREIFERCWSELSLMALGGQKNVERLTGPEGFLVFATDLKTTKIVMTHFEEEHPLGRLFDLDVMNKKEEGKQLSRTSLGFPLRRCFVCTRAAKECAHGVRHSAVEIIEAMTRIVENAE